MLAITDLKITRCRIFAKLPNPGKTIMLIGGDLVRLLGKTNLKKGGLYFATL